MNEDWLHKVRDRISDYEIDAPDNLWESIEEKLEGASATRRPSKAPVILVWTKRCMAVAAVLALVLTLCLNLFNDAKEAREPQLLSSDVQGHDFAPVQKDLTAPEDVLAEATVRRRDNNGIERQIVPNQNTRDNDMETSPAQKSESADLKKTESKQHNNATESKSPDKATDRPKHSYPVSVADDDRYIASITPSDKHSDKFSISVFTSGGAGSILNNHTTGKSYVSSLGPDDTAWEDNPMLGILLFNQGKEIENSVKHHLPIRAGVSAAYNLNDRLAIESGITYTNLTSSIRKGSESHYFTGKQKLYYIGLPLNLKYRIFSWQRLDLYASAGVLMEKCVSAKLDKKYIIDYQNRGSETENLSDKPLQWSANASLGVQCRLVNSISLYAEPGISYYFKDGTDIPTIYKDKPLNFKINLGLRFTFGK